MNAETMNPETSPPPVLRLPGFPPGVQAAITWRGPQATPFGYNLALHTGEDPLAVQQRREALAQWIGAEPCWLQQVHGSSVHELSAAGSLASDHPPAVADASLTRAAGLACTVMVADCLPLLLALSSGERVAAVHAGWRGLAAGVIEASLDALTHEIDQPGVVAWLGPCIGPASFEVGAEVLEAFGGKDGLRACHFRLSQVRSDRWFADLQGLAMTALLQWTDRRGAQLRWAGPPGGCTVQAAARWFSFRREGATGRMAALIWREGQTRGALAGRGFDFA